MSSLSDLFDKTGTVRRPSYRSLLKEVWSLLAYRPKSPDPSTLPDGQGHVVLVIPAFLTGDTVTKSLRDFLARCGYRVFGWSLGINWGPTPRLLGRLRHRLLELREIAGSPISIIGVSLGGILARDLALDRPDDICDVITLVSSFRLPTASTIEPLFHLCAPFYSPTIEPKRLSRPLSMPSLAIYTQDDGIVAWQSCFSDDARGARAEVTGHHLTICRNPEVRRILASRLANTRADPPVKILVEP